MCDISVCIRLTNTYEKSGVRSAFNAIEQYISFINEILVNRQIIFDLTNNIKLSNHGQHFHLSKKQFVSYPSPIQRQQREM